VIDKTPLFLLLVNVKHAQPVRIAMPLRLLSGGIRENGIQEYIDLFSIQVHIRTDVDLDAEFKYLFTKPFVVTVRNSPVRFCYLHVINLNILAS
jgi:hypothetical protein